MSLKLNSNKIYSLKSATKRVGVHKSICAMIFDTRLLYDVVKRKATVIDGWRCDGDAIAVTLDDSSISLEGRSW